MHGYKHFKIDVEETFGKLILDNNLKCLAKLKSQGSDNAHYVKIYNSLFEIEFVLNVMQLSVEVINPVNKESYLLNHILRVLHPEEAISISGEITKNKYSRDYVKSELSSCSCLFSKYLQQIVYGDFSFDESVKEHVKERNNLFKKIINLNWDHPLYQAAMHGNEDWFEKAKVTFRQ